MADLLLVDNDARIVELLGWFLERRGHAVRAVTSYAEARPEIARQRPDLMLADLELGAERGEVELPELQLAGLLPPTLVVSGFLDLELEGVLMGVPGILGTLSKPFDLDRLLERVSACLEEAADLAGSEPEPEPEPKPKPAPGAWPGLRPATDPVSRDPVGEWVEILPPGRTDLGDQGS